MVGLNLSFCAMSIIVPQDDRRSGFRHVIRGHIAVLLYLGKYGNINEALRVLKMCSNF